MLIVFLAERFYQNLLFTRYFLIITISSKILVKDASCDELMIAGIELRLLLLPGHVFNAWLYAEPNYCQSNVLVDTWMLTVKVVYKL